VAPRAGRAWFALGGGTLLSLAMPGMLPGPLAWAGALLVVPGLMAGYALLGGSGRPRRDGYLFGCAFMAWFSWSVHHVMFAAYAAIVLVGGLYFLLVALALAGVGRARGAVYAVAVAAAFWLRAEMPEIHYPHGQPVHALWQLPALLRGVLALGGEPLANALLAALAAALVGCWRGWRLAAPPFATARRRLLLTAAGLVAVGLVGTLLRAAPPAEGQVTVAAVEPGQHPIDLMAGLGTDEGRWQAYRAMLAARLIGPTRELLAAAAPDLVLWPESALWGEGVTGAALAAGSARLSLPRFAGPGPSRLLVGASLGRAGEDLPAAFLVEPWSGVIVGHHEKLCMVPGGEFLPFARLLPDAFGRAVREAFYRALGTPAGTLRGSRQPLLRTAGGTPFGALICYDNAFPEPARGLVADGARFLTVLSNEAWYRGGAELTQLVAQTVCRALENGVPIVRCTTDGWSVAVDRDGCLVAELPRVPAPAPAARVLRTALAIGPAADTPVPWLRAVTGPLAAAGLLLWLGCRGLARCRRRRCFGGPSGAVFGGAGSG
jgi:apolipoprotein N-acyltransferase